MDWRTLLSRNRMPETRVDSGQPNLDWWEVGMSMAASHDYKLAIRCFDLCLDADASAVGCWTMKAICFRGLGMNEEALGCLGRFIECSPEDPQGWRAVAILYSEL